MAVIPGVEGTVYFYNTDTGTQQKMFDIGSFTIEFDGSITAYVNRDSYREASARKKERAWKIKDALHQYKVRRQIFES